MNNMIADHSFDLAELGCGDLAIALMKAMKSIAAGETIEIIARDQGAANDIPAWCRMTGNEFISGPSGTDGSRYILRKKGA
jgi:TusA-related sulfurtransferase